MDRARRLIRLWQWLPAFRAVAETMHLPSASHELGITAPALSRSIRLLEEDLGQPLFLRTGRRLQLNEAGEIFLSALRTAMRALDEGLDRITQRQYTGFLSIASYGHLTSVLLHPLLTAFCRSHPGIVPNVVHCDPDEVCKELCDGSIDISLLETPQHHPELVVEQLAEMSYGLYCGREHPLARASAVPLAELSQHEFVALSEGPGDHWPLDIERRVSLRVPTVHDALHFCRDGLSLAVLPDALVAGMSSDVALSKVPCELSLVVPVFAMYRRPISEHAKLDTFLDALRARIAGDIPGLASPTRKRGAENT